MTNLWRDIRFGFRLLAKKPAFTAIAVLILALGIGPNSAIFSVVYGTLLAPMEFRNPEQLMVVWSKVNGERNGVSAGDYLDWKQQSKSFEYLGAVSGDSFNLTGPGEQPEHISAQHLTPGFLTMLGERPLLGRDFTADEGKLGQDHVVIFSHSFWRQHFASDPNILGRQVKLNGESYTVIGIRPPGSADRREEKMWVPLAFKPEQLNHDFRWLSVIGRLKPGVMRAQAQSEMDLIAGHIAQVYPRSNNHWGALVEPLQNDFMDQHIRTDLWLLMGAVSLILLIACLNVANLLMARGSARQRELAVRASLGASRPQLFLQLLSESLSLAAIGGALGIALSWIILKIFLTLMPQYSLPPEANVQMNVPVLLFTLLTTTIAGVLFGCAPAWRVTRADLNESLKQGARSGISKDRHRLGRTLVIAEFALALSVLAAAGLLIHSFWNRTRVDLGVRTDHVLTFVLPVPSTRFAAPEQITAFYRELLEKIEAVPGVHRAAAATGIPLEGSGFGMPFSLVGRPSRDPSTRPSVGFQMVTPGYLQTFGLRLDSGRDFTDGDRTGTLRVAMVNENFVRQYLRDLDPLKQAVSIDQLVPGVTKLGASADWHIVGVFHNVQNGQQFGDKNRPEVYVPFAQSPWPEVAVGVRTAEDPSSMRSQIAAAVHSADPNLALAYLRTMDQIRQERLTGDRFQAVLFTCLAGLALLLAAAGIYGVMGFVVAQRTQEMGLRMALGAESDSVVRLILREGMTLAVIGFVFGLAGACLVGRLMQSGLYNTGSIDAGAFGTVTLVLFTAALAACYLPARRAAKVDPMLALRQD